MSSPQPTYIKDPAAFLDYGFDWSAGGWLEEGETISTSSWRVPAGLTHVSDGIDGGKAVVWVSGGSPGASYTLTNTIQTSAGRIDERSLVLRVKER